MILIRLVHQIQILQKAMTNISFLCGNLVNEQSFLYITDKHTTLRFKLIYVFGLYFIHYIIKIFVMINKKFITLNRINKLEH